MIRHLINQWLPVPLIAMVVLIFVSQQRVNAQELFVAGKDYAVISTPVRTSDPEKIEVTEVFWYGCGHCNDFRPEFDRWKKQQTDDINVQHSPAMWSKAMQTHARIFYTAKALGKQDAMHKSIFDAIHLQKKQLIKPSEIYKLFEAQGVDREKFDKTFDSFGVDSLVKQADARARGYGITGTPEMVINGKYRISGSMAGSQLKMLKVADYLIDKERAASS